MDISRELITVIIPAMNEAETIQSVVKECIKFGEEVIVVDGHSTDNTREIASQAGASVMMDGGRGKGDAVRTGIREARNKYVVFIDADGSHYPRDIPRLIEPLKDNRAQMTLASRMLGGSDELHGNWTNFIRMVGAGFLTLLLNWRWKSELTDTLNGFRALPTDLAKQLPLTCNGFEIELEMICQVLRNGGHILEVPSHEYERQGGSSKLPTYKGLIFFIRAITMLL